MATEGKKISALEHIDTIKDTDIVIIVETSATGAAQTTKKATVSSLREQLTAPEAVDYYQRSETFTKTEIENLVTTRFNSDQSGIVGGVYNRGNWDASYSWVNTYGSDVNTKISSLGSRNLANGFSGLDQYAQVPLSQLSYVIPTSHPVGGVTQTNINNWNTAYGWGDHSTQGYLTDYVVTQSDVTQHQAALTITQSQISDLVHFDGDYNNLTNKPLNATTTTDGFMSSEDKTTLDSLQVTASNLNGTYVQKSDLADTNKDGLMSKEDFTKLSGIEAGAQVNPTNVSTFTNDAGYITNYTETDPVFSASVASGITGTQVVNWDTAFGWGNHATAGYISNETVTSLSLTTNTLSYTDELGATTNIDLSVYLDDTNLARLVSGTVDGATGVATFTRDDATTFTVDFSALFDDTNLSRITSATFNSVNGNLTLTRDDATTAATVSLDGRYLITETDPVFNASPAGGILSADITNWNTAHGWGDHSTQGYLTSVPVATTLVDGLISSVDKTKLDGIQSGAEVNVQPNWDEVDTNSDAYIQNKPTITNLGTETMTAAAYPTLQDAMLAGAPSNGVFVRLHDNGDTTFEVVYRPIL